MGLDSLPGMMRFAVAPFPFTTTINTSRAEQRMREIFCVGTTGRKARRYAAHMTLDDGVLQD